MTHCRTRRQQLCMIGILQTDRSSASEAANLRRRPSGPLAVGFYQMLPLEFSTC